MRHSRYKSITVAVAVFYLVITRLVGVSHGSETLAFETFLEPNQSVDLASPQRDRLVELFVEEGQVVTQGQLLAVFDTKVLQARLAMLKRAAGFRGAVDSAEALVSLRQVKFDRLRDLEKSGNARPQEVETAATNLAIARAQLQETQENILYKESEQTVILAQIEEKKLFSPVDGVIAIIHKHKGELVGGVTDEPILTVVQLDPLKAEFDLPPSVTELLEEQMVVMLLHGEQQREGVVTFISPIIAARSGTIQVRVELPNKERELTSGSRITFQPVFQSETPIHDRNTSK